MTLTSQLPHALQEVIRHRMGFSYMHNLMADTTGCRVLPLIERFLRELESEEVIYCQWKSNAFMARAAQGEDDLDLLVSHSCRQVFLEILCRLGFKEGSKSKDMPQSPGILDYYGYDETTCSLIHIHVHYKLIIGHDMNKNYHLPIEQMYLDSSSQGEFFRIPAPEFEFIVLIIRMMLKHSTWIAMLGGQGKLSVRERGEVEYLEHKISFERIDRILAQHLPFLSFALFTKCIRALEQGSPFWYRLKAGEQLQKSLRGCRLHSELVNIFLQLWRRMSLGVKRRVFRVHPRRIMKNGGILVAFVGGDGSGKTTIVGDTSKWLSARFATVSFHMGKPPWSRVTFFIRGLLKISRKLRQYHFRGPFSHYRQEKNPTILLDYPSLIRAVCAARDRYLSYVRARRLANCGVLVICDRFPLPHLVSMEGPRIDRMTGDLRDKWLIKFLGRIERKYYHAILMPDLLFVLRLNPKTAVQRKPEDDPAAVWVRNKEIWERKWEGTDSYIIDAAQGRAEVLRKTKALLWSRI